MAFSYWLLAVSSFLFNKEIHFMKPEAKPKANGQRPIAIFTYSFTTGF